MTDSAPPQSLAEQLAGDPSLAETLVEALVTAGRFDQGGVRLDALEALPADKALLKALNARQGSVEPALQQVRLARLYALAGKTTRAAKSFRLALQRKPLSLSLAVTLAEQAAQGGDRVLALGLLDWLASRLGTRDDRASDRDLVDPVRSDSISMCNLLRRAGLVALSIERPLRCVALMRTAAQRLERLDLMRESDGCLKLAVEALQRAGHPDKALDFAMRLLPRAKERESPEDEALALALVSELLSVSRDTQDFERAQTCRKEAAKLLTHRSDHAGALEHIQAVAALEARADPAVGLKTLEGAITRAQTEDLDRLACALSLEAARLELRLGKPGKAMSRAESVRKDKAAGELAPQAALLAAESLVYAGDVKRAHKALSKWDSPWGDPSLAAWALRVRGELAALEKRPADGRAYLQQAARVYGEAFGQQAARCLLLSGSIAYGEGDTEEASASLERAKALDLLGPLEVRAEVLAALLSEDPDEREILLDDAQERAAQEGDLEDRVIVSVEQARAHAAQGSTESAIDVLESAVGMLLGVRSDLPAPLRGAFGRSRLCAAALRLGSNEDLTGVLEPLSG